MKNADVCVEYFVKQRATIVSTLNYMVKLLLLYHQCQTENLFLKFTWGKFSAFSTAYLSYLTINSVHHIYQQIR